MAVGRYNPTAVTLTLAAGVWTASASVERPIGTDLFGVQVVAAGTFNGSTITARVQGSNDGTNWINANDGSTSHTAAGSAMMGGAEQIVGLGQFRYYRFNASHSGGPPTDGATLVFSPVADFDGGSQ